MGVVSLLKRSDVIVDAVRSSGLVDLKERVGRYFFRPYTIRKNVGPHQFQMYIDNRMSEEWYAKASLSPITEFYMRHIVSTGDLVVDAGAHNGYYSLLSALCVGETGTVIACEALVSNYATLVKNIEINDLPNVWPHHRALGSERRMAYFTSYNNGIMLDRARYSVDMVPLPDVVDRPIDVLKVDVEGAEYDVLVGSGSLITYETTILCEVHPDRLRNLGQSPEMVIDWLRARHPNLLICGETEGEPRPYEAEVIDRKCFLISGPIRQ